MSREIKFRPWNKEDAEYELPFTLDEIHDDWWENNTAVYEFEQFTGLLDKNGVEIYKGDILLGGYNAVYDFARWSVSFRDGRYQTDCVALHHKDDGFRDISHGGYSNPYLDGKTCASFEVIGNVHENPGLLT